MPCNLCQSEDTKIVFHSDLYPDGRTGDVVKCKKCGLIFRDRDQTSQFSTGRNNPTGFRTDNPAKMTKKRIRIFNDYVNHAASYRKHNRILDVGSGHGFFLKFCSEKGWNVWGVEKDPQWVRFSKEKLGIQVANGRFEETEFSDNFFDVVTFINVFEHLKDPYTALKKAYQILRPGGAVFLRFPNAALHVPYRFVIYHLYPYCKGIKRFDVSSIYAYAFDSLSIFRYLNKTNFKNQIIENDMPSSVSLNIKELGFEKVVIKYLVIGLANIIKKITHGKRLIASSLSVRAVKL